MKKMSEQHRKWAEAQAPLNRKMGPWGFVSETEARSRTGGRRHPGPERAEERRKPHRLSKLQILGCGGREKECAPILRIGWRGKGTGGGAKRIYVHLPLRAVHLREDYAY